MRKTHRCALAALIWSTAAGAAYAAPQESAAAHAKRSKTKYAKVFKREVDGTINGLCQSIGKDGSFGGSALTTAKVLTLMGHSHRFYTLGDGPVVRRPVHFLFTRRDADGAFVDPGGDPIETTRWVMEALRVTDPIEHATELADGARWLRDKQVRDASPWRRQLLELSDRIRRERSDPKQTGQAAAAALAYGPARMPEGSIDFNSTIESLMTLVACQSIGRRLDKTGSAAIAAFSSSAQKGIDYLKTRQRGGEFLVSTPGGEMPDVGLSGLGLAAMQTKPAELRTKDEQALIDQGLAKLTAAQNPDGSFGKYTVNYATCAAVLALSMAEDPSFDAALDLAQKYVLTIQNIEDRGYAQGDRDYGSIGYGGDQRGDLSNLGLAIQALRQTELDENHEAFAKAIVFLQRTQNLRSVNDFEGRRVKDDNGEWQTVTSGDDGGAAYYPGNSPAGYIDQPDGKRIPRSYGSMTYMLLRTYTLCGLKQDDVRVRKAIEWIARNWSLDENPGSSPLKPEKAKYQGLYYYYMVLAQALDSAGVDPLVAMDAEGGSRQIDWRSELAAALAARQQVDGSWINDRNDRWWEGQKSVCTIYALLALQRCQR